MNKIDSIKSIFGTILIGKFDSQEFYHARIIDGEYEGFGTIDDCINSSIQRLIILISREYSRKLIKNRVTKSDENAG